MRFVSEHLPQILLSQHLQLRKICAQFFVAHILGFHFQKLI